MSDEVIAALEGRIAALEETVRNMRALAKGDPGRDGKDGRDGRDGIDAKPVSAQRVFAAIRNSMPRHAPAVNFDAHVMLNPEFSIPSPTIFVAAPDVTFSPVLPQMQAPEVNVHVDGATVNIPAEAIMVSVRAEVPAAPEPWPTETEIVSRDPEGRANVMQTRPLPKKR